MTLAFRRRAGRWRPLAGGVALALGVAGAFAGGGRRRFRSRPSLPAAVLLELPFPPFPRFWFCFAVRLRRFTVRCGALR